MASLLPWFQQATTGAGISALAGTAVAIAAGQLSWQAAAPLLVSGVIAALWPEQKGLQADTQALVADALKIYSDVAERVSTVSARAGSQSPPKV